MPTAEKNIHGYWIISDIVAGRLVKRVYIGYTKKEALREFARDTKELRK